MKFGLVKTSEALGVILAHSVKLEGRAIRKGRVLDKSDIDALLEAGVAEITAAELETGDLWENDAAEQLAQALKTDYLRLAETFTGRANLFAEKAGVLRVDEKKVAAVNAISEDVTLATLPDFAKVQTGQMIATIKIIPYGVAGSVLVQAVDAAKDDALYLRPFTKTSATLILTKTPGMNPQLLSKAEAVLRDRLALVDI